MRAIEIVEGDITALRVDAIVNAANETLLGGGGVDGARRPTPRAAGELPQLRPNVRCPTGQARITPGFDLPAKFVIHTVGPVWAGGSRGDDLWLRVIAKHSLENCVRSIAFPAIVGVYGYPLAAAAAKVRTWQATLAPATRVTFCCFGTETLAAYSRIAEAVAENGI